jgi:parvulin-like peptidyl-prolyl isomerase
MRTAKLILLAAFLLTTLFGCSMNNDTLLKVDDWTLDGATFKKMLDSKFTPAEIKKMSRDELEGQLQDILNQRLVTEEAYALSMDTLRTSRDTYDATLREAALSDLFDIKVRSKFYSDSALRDFYEHDKVEVNARHILIKVNNERSDEEAEALINKIHHMATVDSVPFGDLIDQYNEDETTRRGRIGWFQWGKMVDEFQEVAFATPVDSISDPVRSAYGWHLINVVGRRDRPLPPYEEFKDKVRQRVENMLGVDVLRAGNEYGEKLADKYIVRFDSANVNKMVDMMTATTELRKNPNPFHAFDDEDRKMQLAELAIEPKEFTLGDLERYTMTHIPLSQRTFSRSYAFDRIRLVLTQALFLPYEAKKEGLYDTEKAKAAAKENMELAMFYTLRKQKFDSIAEPTEDELREFYDTHPDEFRLPVRYSGRWLEIEDQLQQAHILRALNAEGKSLNEVLFERVNAALFKRKPVDAIRVNPQEEFPQTAEAFEGADVGDVVGPLAFGKVLTFMQITEIHPEVLPTFEAAREKAKRLLKKKRNEELYAAWTDSLREKYDYKVYAGNIQHVFEK